MPRADNYRVVHVKGRVSKEDAQVMIQSLVFRESRVNRSTNIYYLQFGQELLHLGEWVFSNGKIKGCGETLRGTCHLFSIEQELQILATRFHSLNIIMNVGGDYGDRDCIVSYGVADGHVWRFEEPSIIRIPMIHPKRIQDREWKISTGLPF